MSKLKFFPQILTFALFASLLKYIFRTKIENKEKLAAVRRPVVVIANHASKLDPFVILSAMGWRHFLKFYPWKFPLAKSRAEKWWIGKPAALVGCYEISGKGDLEESLKETLKAVDGGYSMIFFPEGKMVRKGEVASVKKGIGYISANRRVRLLPVKIIHNNFDKRGRGRQMGARIIFGDAFDCADLRKKNDPETLHLRAMDKVYDLYPAV